MQRSIRNGGQGNNHTFRRKNQKLSATAGKEKENTSATVGMSIKQTSDSEWLQRYSKITISIDKKREFFLALEGYVNRW